MEKSIIIFLFFLCCTIATQAQTAPRYDTVMVAVYNTGAKYRIAPADFGASTSTLFDGERKFVGTLVAGNDTVHTWGTKNCDTCTTKKQTILKVTHGCNNINGDINGKVVIIDLGKCTDATLMAFSAQKQGAKAVIFAHKNDNRDSLQLSKGAVGDSVTIPVFAVRNTTGAKMSAMLPSHIGIKEPKILKNDTTVTQALKQVPEKNPTQNKVDAVTKTISETEAVKDSINQTNNRQLSFSPNPTEDVIYLRYHFDNPQTVEVSIINAAGALVFFGKINAQSTEGEYEIDTKGWATGIYVVSTFSNGVKLNAEKIVISR